MIYVTSLRIEEPLMKRIDKTIKDSNKIYKDRTHFIILAIQEKLEKVS